MKSKYPTSIYIPIKNGIADFSDIRTNRNKIQSIKEFICYSLVEENYNLSEDLKPMVIDFCNKFKIEIGLLFGKSRKPEVVAPRYSLLYYLKELKDLTSSRCEKELPFDHATFLRAIRVVDSMIETKDKYYEKYFNNGKLYSLND